jgi:hypothetical protein
VLFAARAGTLDVPRRSGWPRRPSPPPTPRTGHGSSGHRLREPILVQGALPACWCIGTLGRPPTGTTAVPGGARCARLIIESRLLSNPRLAQWGKTLVSAPSARIRLGRLATAVQTQDALPVARLVVPNTISFPWLQGKQLGQPPDFSMISPPELQPATTMTLEIDPQVRYQQNPSEAAQHAAVRAMVDYVVAAASWAAVMDKTSLLESPKAPR